MPYRSVKGFFLRGSLSYLILVFQSVSKPILSAITRLRLGSRGLKYTNLQSLFSLDLFWVQDFGHGKKSRKIKTNLTPALCRSETKSTTSAQQIKLAQRRTQLKNHPNAPGRGRSRIATRPVKTTPRDNVVHIEMTGDVEPDCIAAVCSTTSGIIGVGVRSIGPEMAPWMWVKEKRQSDFFWFTQQAHD